MDRLYYFQTLIGIDCTWAGHLQAGRGSRGEGTDCTVTLPSGPLLCMGHRCIVRSVPSFHEQSWLSLRIVKA